MRLLQIVSGILLFWAGFISSISFLEAWLKFRAPGVTLSIGLAIGKLVFRAKNHAEWLFLLAATFLVFTENNMELLHWIIPVSIVMLALCFQTFWFLPVLNRRADRFISGETPGKSTMHLYYGTAEILKVLSLVYAAFHIILLNS